ncbi:MAG TPA: Rieske 2Fe-2S domain-containing protein [Actinomycetota bacterium]|nr:Rieske 2Fe-2S domain-containing protein [Actinomycetota bacterium]
MRVRIGAPPRPDRSLVRGTHRRATFGALLVADWRATGWPLGILRAFLGGTFVFAGMQKLLDPNFLRRGSADFIGTQLAGFARDTPLAGVFRMLAHHAVLVGLGTALLETAIGLAVLLGIVLPIAALAGFAINLSLLLSATWHVHPYFLGSDSIYAVAWLALAIGTWSRLTRTPVPGAGGRVTTVAAGPAFDRRAALQLAAVGSMALALDLAARMFRGSPSSVEAISPAIRRPASTPATHTPAGSPSSTGGASSSSGGTSTGGTSTAPPPAGTLLTTLAQLPVGRAVGFEAPGVGPAVLLRLSNDQVLAYSRICTHAGCVVGYDPGARLLVCPCHGAEFDPARGAEPVAGPASSPLQRINVVVDGTGRVLLPA